MIIVACDCHVCAEVMMMHETRMQRSDVESPQSVESRDTTAETAPVTASVDDATQCVTSPCQACQETVVGKTCVVLSLYRPSSSLSVVTDCWKATTRAVGFGADGGPGQVTEAVNVWLTTKLSAYKSRLSATAWVSTCRPQSLTAKLKHLVLRTYISRPRFEGWMRHEPAYSSCLDQLENTGSWCSQPSDRLQL